MSLVGDEFVVHAIDKAVADELPGEMEKRVAAVFDPRLMEQFFIIAGVLLLLLMLPVFYCVFRGPTAIDRIVGINVIGTKTTVTIIFIGTIFRQ